ncbi:transcriptional regulator, partial [Staphylococcus aureus]
MVKLKELKEKFNISQTELSIKTN